MNKYCAIIILCLTTTTTFANQNAINNVKSAIKESLKDPDSVVFKNVRVVTNTKGEKSICGSYNAKNSYGGYVGYTGFSADVKNGNITALEGLDDYVLSGCSGKNAELELIQSKKNAELELIQRKQNEKIYDYVKQRSSEICKAQGEFLVKVMKKKKPVELAFQEVQLNIENNPITYATITRNNNALVNMTYYKEYKPSIEEYVKFLNKIQSDEKISREMKFSFSEYLVGETLKKIMPKCEEEQFSLYRKQ